MRKPETFLSRTLTRLGFKSKTNSAKRFGEATRLRTFEPLERRQLLSVVTWTGLGSDNNWGTAANWSTNAAPTAGDDLVFSGSTRTATQNNLAAGTSFHSIEFKNNSFTLSGNSLTLTSGVIIDSGVTGTNVTLAGIGLSGNVTFNVATTSVTVSSAISGAGRLVKSGSGTLILTGADTYTGGTTISAGALQLGNGGATGSIVGDVVNSGQLIVNRTGSLTLSGVVSGAGSLSKLGSGTLILSGNNTYTGGTSISAGKLQLGSSAALGYNNLTINGGTVDLAGHGLEVRHLNGSAGGLITTNAGSATLQIDDGGTYAGRILDGSGSIGLRVEGWGDQLTLSGENTFFTGGTIIDGATVNVGNNWALGYGNVTMIGGVLDLGGHDVFVTHLNGDAASSIINSTGFSTLLIGAGGDFEGTLRSDSLGELALYVMQWGDPLTLGGNNNFGGGVLIEGGTVLLKSDTALGYGNLTMTGGATLDLGGHSLAIGGLNGDGWIGNSSVTSNSTLTLNGNGTFSGVIEDALGSGTQKVALVVSHGTLILTGANTYTGGTVIDIEAALQIGDGGSTGSLTGDISDGGTLIVNRTGDLTMLGGIFGNGGLIKRGVGTLVIGGDNMFFYGDKTIESGIVRVDADWALGYGNITMAGGELDMNGHDVMAVYLNGDSGRITNGAGDSALLEICRGGNYQGEIVDGAGTVALDVMQGGDSLTLGGDNTYTGGTTIGVGSTVNAWSDAALGLGDLTLNGGTVNLNGHDLEVRHLISADSSSLIWNDGEFATLQVDEGGVFRGQIRDSGVSNLGVRSMGWGDAFSLAGANTYSGGTTISGGTLQIGGSLVGNIVDNSSLVVDISGTLTLSGVISGSGSLTKAGSGTLTLSGANTYSGGTTITGGTLQIGNGGTIGSVVGGIVDNGTLVVNRSNAWTLSGVISGSGGLVKAGTGTLTVSGANTYSGTTTVRQGTLSVATIAVSGGASNIGNSTSAVILGDTSGHTGILSYTGANGTFTRGLNILSGGGEFDVAVSGRTETIATGNISASGAFTIGGLGNTAISSVISGVGSLTKIGAGTLTLSGANTYTGVTRIQQGTLSASSIVVSGGASNLGNATSAVVLGDTSGHKGILAYTGTSATYIRGFNILSGGGEIDVETTGQTLTIAAGGIADSSSFTIGGVGNTAISSVISGEGSLAKTGSGDLTLSGANTYTGTTTIAQGKLNASSVVVSGDIRSLASNLGNATSAVVLGDALGHTGILSYTGASATFTRGFTVQYGEIDVASGKELTISTNDVAINNMLTIGGAGSVTIARNISGGGGLTLAGSGNLTLSGENSYRGQTKISAGSALYAASNSAFGVSSLQVDGKLDLTGHSVTVGDLNGTGMISNLSGNSVGTLIVTGSGTFSGTIDNAFGSSGCGTALTVSGGCLTLSGTNTFYGPTTIINGGTLNLNANLDSLQIINDGLLNITNSTSFTLANRISGSGTLAKSGSGKLTLSGDNFAYSGLIMVSAGSLAVGSNTALGTGELLIDGGAEVGLNGYDNSVHPLSSVYLYNGNISDGTLTANLSFNLQNGYVFANLSGAGSLTKTGSGTVTLLGVNTYLGSTNASEGVLLAVDSQSLPLGTVVTGAGTAVYSQTTLYWNGGAGNWNAANAWHFADGSLTSWIAGSHAAFSGGGAITISGSVNVISATFASGNYFVSGGQINVPYFSCIDTGTGTVSISSDLVGEGILGKKGSGTLALTGAPDFTGTCLSMDGMFSLDFTSLSTSPPAKMTEGDGRFGGLGVLSLQDAALYQEVQTRFTDLLIDRSEMLAILNSVAARGAVTAAELSDLQTIIDNPQIVFMPDYVHVLASYVVNVNQANALYQGQTLGNLAVGSSASQLTTLISKWFYGTDHPTALGTYGLVNGNLADSDGTFGWDDMSQGYLGDCWLIASLGTLGTASQSAINNMFINNGDGTWTIRLYAFDLSQGGAVTDYVTVDQYLPQSSGGDRIYASWGHGLWIPLIEKAFAQWCETGHPQRAAVNAYSSVEAGLFYEAFMAVTGRGGTSEIGTSAICAALDNHMAVGLNSNFVSADVRAKYGIVATHGYAVVGYYYDSIANDYRFVLKNPWGYGNPSDVLGADLAYLDIVDPSGTTPASSDFTYSIYSRPASTTLAVTSFAAALDFAYSPKAVSTTSSESIFNRIASQPFFDNRREAASLPTESQTRADAIAALSVDFSSGFNSAEKLATAGVVEDISSDYVSLAPAADSTDLFADFDLVRHLHSHKKLTQLEEATDAVFAEKDAVFGLL